jgi:epoxyqueuosine reductase
LKRNAAVVLGNAGSSDDVPVLEQALDAPEPLVREHAAWALARLRRADRSEVQHRVESAVHPDERRDLPDRE